jgi:DNA-binding NarL/FixJ family response regulator
LAVAGAINSIVALTSRRLGAYTSPGSPSSPLFRKEVAPIRVAVWTESRLWAEALELLLSHESAFEPAGRWREVPTESRVPDILLVDAQMRDALGACASLKRTGDRPRTILLATEADGRLALSALESGARGILGRDAGSAELLKAIRVVHQGQIWAGGDIVARGLEELATFCETGRVQESALARLSAREKQVALRVASGHGNKEIARGLSISEATVKAHMTQIFQKLGLRSRTELAAALNRPRGSDSSPGTR